MRPSSLSRVVRISLALVLAPTLVAAVSRTAYAQSDADRGQARLLGQEGQSALDAGDFKTAEDRFRRAYSIYPTAPTLALGLARALAKQGKVTAAQETYNKIIREGVPPGASEGFKKAVTDATAEIGAVAARTAYATITLIGPENAKVTLDGISIPSAGLGVKRPVDPGEHVVKATAEGYRAAESKFSVADAASAEAKLTMETDAAAAVVPVPAPGSQPAPTPGEMASSQPSASSKGGGKTLAFVALGVGGAGLAVGAITGLLALGKHSDLKSSCASNGTCGADQQSSLDSFHTMGTISTVGFIVGVVGVGAGTVLLLTAPKQEPAHAGISPYIGLGSVGATGRF